MTAAGTPCPTHAAEAIVVTPATRFACVVWPHGPGAAAATYWPTRREAEAARPQDGPATVIDRLQYVANADEADEPPPSLPDPPPRRSGSEGHVSKP